LEIPRNFKTQFEPVFQGQVQKQLNRMFFMQSKKWEKDAGRSAAVDGDGRTFLCSVKILKKICDFDKFSVLRLD